MSMVMIPFDHFTFFWKIRLDVAVPPRSVHGTVGVHFASPGTSPWRGLVFALRLLCGSDLSDLEGRRRVVGSETFQAT